MTIDRPPEVARPAFARGEDHAAAMTADAARAPGGGPRAAHQPRLDEGKQPPTTIAAGRASVRIIHRWKPRPTRFEATPATVAAALEPYRHAPPGHYRLLLVGEPPGGHTAAERRLWALGDLPPGWASDGHYLEGAMPVLHYTDDHADRADDIFGTVHLEVARAAAWFGEGDYSADQAQAGWRLLESVAGELFDGGLLLSTPASTGRYLWQRTIGWGQSWPVLCDQLQELLRTNFGQGRIEVLTDPDRQTIAELVQVDGRFMYAGLCAELGAGEPIWDHGDGAEPYRRGFYRATFAPPEDWRLPGILPVRTEEGAWSWPTTGRHETWCDGTELRLAAANGWPFTISERILFPRYKGQGPLDTWANKIKRGRGRLLDAARRPGADRVPIMLAAAGLRAILLHGIGAFHGRPAKVTRSSRAPDQVPHGAHDLRVEAGHYVWSEQRGQARPETCHPEWSCAIWARCRARLLDAPTSRRGVRGGLLHAPPGTVLATRTDAIYLDHNPAWPDQQQRVGHFRVVGAWPGPHPAPRAHADLEAIKEAHPHA